MTKKIKRRVNKLRNAKLQQEANEINHFAAKREVEDLFRSFKADGSTFKSTKRKNRCDQEKLREFFTGHFSLTVDENDEPNELKDTPEYIKVLQQINSESINTEPPTKDEIRSTLLNLKNGKASNDLPANFFKYATTSDKLLTEIESLLSDIWNTHTVPTSCGHSKLIALWKGASKGSATDPSTYRGLQIGSSLCKIMVIIILNRLSNWYDEQLLDQQQGFRRGRGTAGGIFVTKRVQQISEKIQKPIMLLFVDLSSVFDHVIRKWLFKSIYQRFSPDACVSLIKLLEALYGHTTTSLAENPEDVFKLLTGVRQGGPESPMLYNLFIDYVMRVYMERCEAEGIKFLQLKYRIRSTARTREERRGVYYEEHTIDWSGYADDLMLVFESEQELQRALLLPTKHLNAFTIK